MTIGKKILYLREVAGMKQKELADKAGITEATLSRYENDLRQPKSDILSKIASALDTTTDYLLGNETKKENEFLQYKEALVTISKKNKISEEKLIKIIEALRSE